MNISNFLFPIVGIFFRWILTAAHCLLEKIKLAHVTRRFEARIGLGKQTSGIFEKTFIIADKNQHIHPQYDPGFVVNDIGLLKITTEQFNFPTNSKNNNFIQQIALIELPEVIEENGRIQIAKLPKVDNCRDGNERVIAIGTGRSKIDGPNEDYHNNFIRQAEFITMNSYKCREHRLICPLSTICAKTNGTGAVYKGDSGKLNHLLIIFEKNEYFHA